MGSEARERMEKRNKRLAWLAKNDSDKFRREWTRLVDHWLCDLRYHAKDGKMESPTLFSFLDRAKKVLVACGKEAMALGLPETEMLLNECCREWSRQIADRTCKANTYRLSLDHELYGIYKINRRLKRSPV
ncbi:MAG: hypothetical protein JW884_01260 [Deltaproteobacteria bacterium]|nr:hypothetical protein [Deltaproteobacteria bacterium]